MYHAITASPYGPVHTGIRLEIYTLMLRINKRVTVHGEGSKTLRDIHKLQGYQEKSESVQVPMSVASLVYLS